MPARAIEQLYARQLCVQRSAVQRCECGIHDLFVEGADIFSLNQLCADLDWDDPDGSFSVASERIETRIVEEQDDERSPA